MHHLIYVSTATRLMDVTELRQLLITCRARNTALGVTGALLYRDGTFMQVLEGDQPVIASTYDRICQDARHYDVTLIIDGDTGERQFSDWSMAFRDLTSEPADVLDGFSPFMAGRGTDSFGPDPSTTQKILMSFRSLISSGPRF